MMIQTGLRDFTAGLLAMALFVAMCSPLLGAPLILETVEGSVTAYEQGKTITLEVEEEKTTYSINDDTEIEGDIKEGVTVKVTHKDGVASKIACSEK